MPNMGNSFVYFRHSSVPGVKWQPLPAGLIQDRPSEPASSKVIEQSAQTYNYRLSSFILITTYTEQFLFIPLSTVI